MSPARMTGAGKDSLTAAASGRRYGIRFHPVSNVILVFTALLPFIVSTDGWPAFSQYADATFMTESVPIHPKLVMYRA